MAVVRKYAARGTGGAMKQDGYPLRNAALCPERRIGALITTRRLGGRANSNDND